MQESELDAKFIKIHLWPSWLNTSFFSVVAFSLSWILTFFFIRVFWGNKLLPLNPLIWVADFLLPLAAICFFIFVTRNSKNKFRFFVILFVLLLSLALVNIFVLNSKLMNYGDRGTLSGMLGHGEIFPRWMTGTAILGFLVRFLSPLLGNINELYFVKITSALVICIASVLLIWKNHQKFGVLLAITSPIWILFTSGYDEYYPFIAALFLVFLLLLTEEQWMQKINPLFFGILTAFIGLTYAGFVPLCGILLLIYAIRKGLLKGIQAGLFSILAGALLVFLFYGTNFLQFPQDYLAALNLQGAQELTGEALNNSPFYNLRYAFSKDNLSRANLQFFWSGSIPYLLIIIAGICFCLRKIVQKVGTRTCIIVGVFLVLQLLFMIFMVPYLGTVMDIDLFFSVYLTLAFIAGWLIDHLITEKSPETQDIVRITSLSFCTGSSAVILVYLMFLGLFALV